MQDRFLCKAKKVKNKKRTEWVQGYYAVIGGREVIIKNQTEKYYVADEGKKASGNEIVPIRPATLCQCTGLKDKNGNLIWEGDIIKRHPSGNHFTICWNKADTRFIMEGKTFVCDLSNYWSWQVEVVGNKFDNAELLEVE